MPLAASGVLLLLLIATTVAQENEVECLTECGNNARILAVVRDIQTCCRVMRGGAFNFPGSGAALTCASCESYQNINGEIGFSFDRRNIQLNENLQAECVVATQSGLMNPRADITWLGPDGSVYNSTSGVPFERVVRGGTEQQEARLPLMFRPFGPADAGEYSCLASITSDDFPGSQTQVYRSLEIPSRVDPSTFPTPVYPSRQDNVPVAGQPYIIDCIVDSPDALTNSDVMWISPTGETITDTSPRVFVEDVSPGERPGSWVRRLVFNPLSTEDSGPYTCTSPRGDRVQTLTVNVPMPNTTISSVPPTAVEEQPLQIDCSSAVPPSLQGVVTVTILDENERVLAENTGVNRAETVFSIPRASASDSGNYTCRVTVRSSFLTLRNGVDRPLQDTETLPVPFTPSPDTPPPVTPSQPPSVTPPQPSPVTPSQPPPDTPPQPSTPEDTPATPASPDTPLLPSPSPSLPSPDTPSLPSLPSPVTPASPEIDEPSVAPSDAPDIGLPELPPCNNRCHTNADCINGECVCKEGYSGYGDICCIPDALIALGTMIQPQPGTTGVGVNTEEEEEEDDEDREDSTRKSKKKSKKSKRRGRRSHKSKGKKRSKCTPKKRRRKKCRTTTPEEVVPMDPVVMDPRLVYDVTVGGSPECLRILNDLRAQRGQ